MCRTAFSRDGASWMRRRKVRHGLRARRRRGRKEIFAIPTAEKTQPRTPPDAQAGEKAMHQNNTVSAGRTRGRGNSTGRFGMGRSMARRTDAPFGQPRPNGLKLRLDRYSVVLVASARTSIRHWESRRHSSAPRRPSCTAGATAIAQIPSASHWDIC